MNEFYMIINKETAETKIVSDMDDANEFLSDNNISRSEVIIIPCIESTFEMKVYPNADIHSKYDFVAEYEDGLLNSDLEKSLQEPVRFIFAE